MGEKKVRVRLADGHPMQELPGFGSCEGGGTLEVTEEVAGELCTQEHWSREGTAAKPKTAAVVREEENER